MDSWSKNQDLGQDYTERKDSRALGKREDCFAPKTMITAEKRLEHFHEDKLFLYVDTWDPHEPWEAPSWYVKAYYLDYAGQIIEPCYGSWHRCGLEKEGIEIAHACYRGEVTMVDRWIGHLLEKIEYIGLMDNTIIVFTSDHGFHLKIHSRAQLHQRVDLSISYRGLPS